MNAPVAWPVPSDWMSSIPGWISRFITTRTYFFRQPLEW
jgi:hypothetical protein